MKTYKVTLESGLPMHVQGRPVKLEGLPDVEFFYHLSEDGEYVISEASSGCAITWGYKRLKDAKESAQIRIKRKGAKAFKSRLKRMLKQLKRMKTT